MKTVCAFVTVLGFALLVSSCEIVGNDPAPTTVPAQSVVLDGKTYSIVSAEIEQSSLNDGIYDIFLYLSEGQKGCINIVAYREHEGKNINLTSPDATNGRESLQIKTLTGGSAQFTVGSFYIKRLNEGTNFNIVLRDGSFVDSSNGRTHTIAINFSGVLSAPVPENTVILDGDIYRILSAMIYKSDLDYGNYDIFLYTSKSDYVRIGANRARHNGVVINLTKSEDEHGGWSPIVEANQNGKALFRAYLRSGFNRLFSTGSLYIYQNTGTNFQIRLSNGTVNIPDLKFGDGKAHSIEINYCGEPTLN